MAIIFGPYDACHNILFVSFVNCWNFKTEILPERFTRKWLACFNASVADQKMEEDYPWNFVLKYQQKGLYKPILCEV